jgi:hypothetical protein
VHWLSFLAAYEHAFLEVLRSVRVRVLYPPVVVEANFLRKLLRGIVTGIGVAWIGS